jgi:hypothetical protein
MLVIRPPMFVEPMQVHTTFFVAGNVRFIRSRSRTRVWTGASRTGQALRDTNQVLLFLCRESRTLGRRFFFKSFLRGPGLRFFGCFAVDRCGMLTVS